MCEDEIERAVPRITAWHHEACRVMTNGDCEGLLFNPILTQIMDFLKSFYIGKAWKKPSRKPQIRWDATYLWHNYVFNITMTSRIDVLPGCGQCTAVHLLNFTNGLVHGMWDRIFSYGQNSGNPDQVEHSCKTQEEWLCKILYICFLLYMTMYSCESLYI